MLFSIADKTSVSKLFLVALLVCVTCLVDTAHSQQGGAANSGQIVIPSALILIAESIEIPVEQSGVLSELRVKPGQRVAQGELIARVKDEALILKLERARFEHELAKMAAESKVDFEYSYKSHEVAVSDLRRSTEANNRVSNSVPAAKIEKQQLEKDRTSLKLTQARRDLTMAAFRTKITSNEISLAKSELAKTTIRSPMAGLVVSVEGKVGEWVESSKIVCKVVRTDRMQIEGLLAAKDARRIKPGTQARIRFNQGWIEPREIPCEIVFVSPEANPINSKLMVRAEFDNQVANVPAGLKADIVIDSSR